VPQKTVVLEDLFETEHSLRLSQSDKVSLPCIATGLLEINSIPITPQLARLLKQTLGKRGTGLDEGAFLQQLYDWTLNPATTGWMIEGTKWLYSDLDIILRVI